MILDEKGGGVRISKGSHLKGLRKHKVESNGWISLEDAEENFEENSVVPQINAGDLVIMHPFTIHRSEVNKSEKVRWTFQYRIGSVSDNMSSKMGWPSASYGSKFQDLFPEYVSK